MVLSDLVSSYNLDKIQVLFEHILKIEMLYKVSIDLGYIAHTFTSKE